MRSGVDSNTEAHVLGRGPFDVRDLVYFTGRNRSTDAIEEFAMWNDVYNRTITVVSGQTGGNDDRNYVAGGSLCKIGNIPLVADLSVRTVTIEMSQINSAVQDALRGYDVSFGIVEVHRLHLDPDTGSAIANPLPRYVGFINGIKFPRGVPGRPDSVKVEAVTHTRAMTRISALKRSIEAQHDRDEDDDFGSYTSVAGEWEIYWGRIKGTVAPHPPEPPSPPIVKGPTAGFRR